MKTTLYIIATILILASMYYANLGVTHLRAEWLGFAHNLTIALYLCFGALVTGILATFYKKSKKLVYKRNDLMSGMFY